MTTIDTTTGSDPTAVPAEADNDRPGTSVAPAVLTGEIFTGEIRPDGGDQQPLPFRVGVLDARELLDSPLHRRKDLGDLSGLRKSIELMGVREPLVVLSRRRPAATSPELPATEQGTVSGDEPGEAQEPIETFEVLVGKRRQYAAIAAERPMVPCWIAEDESEAFHIISVLEANSHRKDFEATEEADSYQLLLDYGWDEEAIAKARNLPVEQIKTAVKARRLPARAQQSLNAGTLTLEMAQLLEEFADSPAEQQQLLAYADDEWKLKHEASKVRGRHAYARSRDQAKLQLLVDGVDLTPKPRDFGYTSCTAVAAENLLDTEGQPVDVEQVKKLPGFHAFVEKQGSQARTVVYCEDPAKYGYTLKTNSAYPGLSPQEIAAKQEQERQHAEFLERLRLAGAVRREFIVATYGSAKTARKLLLDAQRAAASDNLRFFRDLDDLYRSLGGLTGAEIGKAALDRVQRSLVAKYVCGQEYNLAKAEQGHAAYLSGDPAIAWLDRLKADKYPPSDAENELYQSLLPAPQAEEPDEDDVEKEPAEASGTAATSRTEQDDSADTAAPDLEDGPATGLSTGQPDIHVGGTPDGLDQTEYAPAA
ncbi:hypothetical protein ACTOB_003704 [Actinoplanes oblitus]|uniref:ParB/Sulfiredoxin domain-containing protein n=1 Tax=Actinoplanes oblitus TaxID=3040509 RepID=A0ABY8WQV3_9ACTN|nr:hypothetical protein [Actinoplanes oblitus]WIN00029.1 hypothetical protein ACTOB_003704 [Actinoplanes oblitus]